MLDEKIKALSDDELEQVTGGVMSDEHKVPELNTLNQLNRNHSALSQSLQRLSSGSKINPSVNSPSDFQISERMRGQIRGIDQANYNAQNGESMAKSAEGAVSSTIDILRTLKEKAVSAATDTNTEVDRASIQKEIENSIAQIDDNALTTFNGKSLSNGTENQAINLDLENMRSSRDANSALKVPDPALQRCLDQEAYIGAARNRPDCTSSNLTPNSENLQPAEDLAKDATNAAREQILEQTAQAMLAQANQQEPNILQLLQ